jgi:hypothetical protein
MKDLQREILSQVAAGTITAAEGAARLETLGTSAPAVAAMPAPPSPPIPASTPAAATRQVKVISNLGSAEIVGDPSVAFAVAEGPLVARQEGDTMVIEHSLIGGDSSFSFDAGRRALVYGFNGQQRAVVRMNPDLPLFAKVRAGDLQIEGVHGPISGEVQAGNCVVRGFRGPLNLVVQAGALDASGRLDTGASKLRCQMGEMKIRLEKGSSVRIIAHSTMGDVSIDGAFGDGAITGSGGEVTIGAGAATLDARCTMGTIRVSPE